MAYNIDRKKKYKEALRAATIDKLNAGAHPWRLFVQAKYLGYDDKAVQGVIAKAHGVIQQRIPHPQRTTGQFEIIVQDSFLATLWSHYAVLDISQEPHKTAPSARMPYDLPPKP